MLILEVEYLTGKSVAAQIDDPERPEWPPHPARLFSALVASFYEATAAVPADATAAMREALNWIAALPAPEVWASDASVRSSGTVYVPTQHIDARSGAHNKQPRSFATCVPIVPVVRFVWPNAAPTDRQRAMIEQLADGTTRLGHSSSLVVVRAPSELPHERQDIDVWQPVERGVEQYLRCTTADQLAQLDEWFEARHFTPGRLAPCVEQGYARRDRVYAAREPARPSVFDDDWIVLERIGGAPLLLRDTVALTEAVRKSVRDNATREMLTGHGPDRRMSRRPHLAYVPLAFVAHEHATGSVLGVAIVRPREREQLDDDELAAAIEPMSARSGMELELSGGRRVVLRRADAPTRSTLLAETWCAESTTWASVTPVALDRFPGVLFPRGKNATHVATKSAEELRAIVARACEHIGLPAPSAVRALPGPWFSGCAATAEYAPFRAGAAPAGQPKLLAHLALEFEKPVRGPILLGAGRFFGLGLFRPSRIDR